MQRKPKVFDLCLHWTRNHTSPRARVAPALLPPSDTATEAILHRYTNAAPRLSNDGIAGSITTDFFWSCSTRRLLLAASKHSRARKSAQGPYQYYFDFPLRGGDCHGCELPFVWGEPNRGEPFTPAQRALSSDLMGYWLAFAKTGGDPNGGAEVGSLGSQQQRLQRLHWPRFDAAGQQHAQLVLDFNATRNVISGAGQMGDLCEGFWDGFSLARPLSDM